MGAFISLCHVRSALRESDFELSYVHLRSALRRNQAKGSAKQDEIGVFRMGARTDWQGGRGSRAAGGGNDCR